MSILCRCPSCEAKFKVDDRYAGRKAKCPRCSQVTAIPAASNVSDSSIVAGNSAVAPGGSGVRPAPPRKLPPVAAAPAGGAKPPIAAAPAKPAPAPSPVSPARPAAPVPAAPGLDAVAAPRRSHGRSGRRRGKSASSNAWILIAGVAAVAVLGLGGGAFGIVWLLRSGESPLGGDGAQLVFDWPEADRGEAMLHIDGQRRELPGAGDAAFSLPAGDHRVRIQRRGYEPIDLSVSLKSGDVHRYAPEWKRPSFALDGGGALDLGELVPPGFEGWTQRYNDALSRAAREKKDVLVALVGSDWNGETRRLASGVFPDARFHERAAESLVLVVIDLPQSQRGYEQLLDSAQNSMLFEEFNVAPDDVPTMVMLDSGGKPFAIENNYDAASASELLADVEAWQDQREERDRLFSHVDGLGGEERAQAAVAAVEWIREQSLTRFYGDRFRQWEQIALQFDPSNAAGYYEALFEANWLVRWYNAGRNEDVALIERIVQEFDTWRQRFEFHNADRAARMHLVAAASLFKLERPEDAVAHIEAGLEHQPSDQQLLVQLQTLSQVFRGELGSGTGFVVAPGLVLTNYHVIEGPGRVVVLSGGAEQEAQVLAEDASNDIALLRVSGAASELPPLPLAENIVGRGARVAAFGYPLGDVLGRGLKLTTGVVSALPEAGGDNMYLLDCRVNPGNSGGPLCNQRGEVIGMVTAKSGISENVDSYGMALPADRLHAFLERSVSGWTPPAVETSPAPMEWDQVDATVSASVLMVLKKR